LDSSWLDRFSLTAGHSEGIALGIVVLFITYFTLVIGELVPKRLALNHTEKIASFLAIPLSKLSVIVSPIIWLLIKSTNIVLFLTASKKSNEPFITEEDIKILISQGTQRGEFEEDEQKMVAGVFRLGNLKIEALATPRKEIVWLNMKDSPEKNWDKMLASRHSHFPVCKDKLDNIIGLVYMKDIWAQKLAQHYLDLRKIIKQPLFVPESALALKVLDLFKQSGIHFALLIDEYGGCQGVVTLKDILEAIVGEMPELGEPTEPTVVRLEDGSWILDGTLVVDEFKEILNIYDLPEDDPKRYYHTLGGFIMKQMGRIPRAGEHFEWKELRFEVKNMDGNRVDKVIIQPLKKKKL